MNFVTNIVLSIRLVKFFNPCLIQCTFMYSLPYVAFYCTVQRVGDDLLLSSRHDITGWQGVLASGYTYRIASKSPADSFWLLCRL